jgi:CubicO group peptidase (beta-lactamase class C family)
MKRIVLLFLLIPFVVSGQGTTPGEMIRQATGLYMSAPASVAISVGVYINGKIYTYHAGELHKGMHDQPDNNTIYYIGSVTKTITGTLLAKAVLENKIRLDDDIRKYLDGDYPNLSYQGHGITVAQLLNHRSGLPFLMPFDTVFKTNNNEKIGRYLTQLYQHYTKADFFEDLHHVKLDTLPGTRFGYSNTSAQLCGYILGKIYGMSYDQLLKKQLTADLGMTSTKIGLSSGEMKRIAPGYDESGKLMPRMPDQMEGAGAVKSTITDMLKYARWHLDENHPAARLSHEPTWQSGNYWAGLNWQVIQSADKKRLIWQSGNVPGFISYCTLYPDDQMAIVVLTNEESHTAPAVIENMINHLSAALKPGVIELPR